MIEERRYTLPEWKQVFRQGFAPNLSLDGLHALRDALISEDKRLINRQTTRPPPIQYNYDLPVECACPIGFTVVTDLGGFGKATVGEVENRFGELCFKADRYMGCPGACAGFLNQIDCWAVSDMWSVLLPEVELAIAQRKGTAQ